MVRSGLTRRQALRFGGAAVGALVLGPWRGRVEGAASQTSVAGGLLRQSVSGRTMNAHVHLFSGEWWEQPVRQASPDRSDSAGRTFEQLKAREMAGLKERGLKLSARDLEANAARLARRTQAVTLEEAALYYLTEMDEAGLDTALLLTVDFSAFPDRDGRRYRLPFEQVLEQTAALRDRFPGRFEVFAGIDSRRGRAGVKLIDFAVKTCGCLGLGELTSSLWLTRPDDRSLCYPYFERCVELGLPVTNDATQNRGFSVPSMFEQIARDFPTLQLCLGGAGHGVDPVPGPDGRPVPARDVMLQLAERYENIWLDLDDWQRRDTDGVRTYVRYLRRALDGPARGRVMYGSDYPIYTWMFSERDWIDTIFTQAALDGVAFTSKEL